MRQQSWATRLSPAPTNPVRAVPHTRPSFHCALKPVYDIGWRCVAAVHSSCLHLSRVQLIEGRPAALEDGERSATGTDGSDVPRGIPGYEHQVSLLARL